MADDLKNKFVACTSREGLKKAVKQASNEGYKKSGPVRRKCIHFRDNLWRLVWTQKMIIPVPRKTGSPMTEDPSVPS